MNLKIQRSVLTICGSSSLMSPGGAVYLRVRRGVNQANLLAYMAKVLALSVNDTQIKMPWKELRTTNINHSP